MSRPDDWVETALQFVELFFVGIAVSGAVLATLYFTMA